MFSTDKVSVFMRGTDAIVLVPSCMYTDAKKLAAQVAYMFSHKGKAQLNMAQAPEGFGAVRLKEYIRPKQPRYPGGEMRGKYMSWSEVDEIPDREMPKPSTEGLPRVSGVAPKAKPAEMVEMVEIERVVLDGLLEEVRLMRADLNALADLVLQGMSQQ